MLCVATTGIYCRPGCPARRPRRENVRFFAHAGKRNAPDSALPALPAERALARGAPRRCGARACRLIESAEEAPDLAALADAAGMSRYHFHRVFKAAIGLTPRAYATAQRARRVREGLHGGSTVTDAITRSASAPPAASTKPPRRCSECRRRAIAAGDERRPSASRSGSARFGSILVAATARGVCAILLGDDPEVLLRDCEDGSRARASWALTRPSRTWWRARSPSSKRPRSGTIAARLARHCVPAAGVAGTARCPGRLHRELRGHRSPPRRPWCGAGGRPGLRGQPGGGGDPVPPGRAT